MGLISGIKNQLLPSNKTGFAYVGLRVTDWGEPVVTQALPASLTAALEGSLMVAKPAPAVGGTGTAMGIQTSFSDTANIALLLKNGEVAGGRSYIPLYVRGRITAAGANSTSSEVSVQVDTINRYSSGGSSFTDGAANGINHVNPDSNVHASAATLYYGAVTAAAAGTRRQYVGSSILKVAASPCWTVNDVILLTFGAAPTFVHQAQVIAAGTTVLTAHVPMAACVIPPVGSMTVHIANVANSGTAPSIEWEVAWIER